MSTTEDTYPIPSPECRPPARPEEDSDFVILYEAPLGSRGIWPKRQRKSKYPPPPWPTPEQVDEFAITIAIDDNIVDKHILFTS